MMASISPMMKMRKRVLEGQLSETNDRIAEKKQMKAELEKKMNKELSKVVKETKAELEEMIAEKDRLIAEIEKRKEQIAS